MNVEFPYAIDTVKAVLYYECLCNTVLEMIPKRRTQEDYNEEVNPDAPRWENVYTDYIDRKALYKCPKCELVVLIFDHRPDARSVSTGKLLATISESFGQLNPASARLRLLFDDEE